MDAKDIQSDLRALKRLYGLLGDGTTKTDSDLLDDHSRLVLKNLLDAATERVLLKLHLEVVGGPSEESQSCEQGKDTGKESKMDALHKTTVKQMHFYDDDVALNSSKSSAYVLKNESDHCLWNEQEIKLNNKKISESKSDEGRQSGPYASSNLDGAKMCNDDDIDSTSSKPDCVSKDGSEAIKQIELCITAFHRGGADPQLPAKPKQYVGEDNFLTTSNLLSSQGVMKPIGIPMYYYLPPNQPYLSLSQTCKLFEPTEATLRQSSTNSNFIRTGGLALMSGELRDQCESPTNKKIYGQNVEGKIDSTNNEREICGQNAKNKIESGKWKKSPDQHVTWLLHKNGISRNRTRLQHQESESTDTDSYQQSTSSHGSDSEEYSLTDESREHIYKRSSSRSSGSWGSSTGPQYSSSYTSDSEENVYSSSSTGDGAPQITSSISSSSKSEGSTPKKTGPSRIHRPHGINHKKHLGVWKRLQDRLAIVFHHHRHHLHGHHTNDEAKMSRHTSLGKHLGKVVNFKRQEGEMAAERIKKSVVHEKKQHSHFHRLVEGLLRHVGQSKQSKTGKGKDRQHGRNKTLNKSHWWQLLQHHHKGAKFPHTVHGKLGLGKGKPRLKALPNIK